MEMLEQTSLKQRMEDYERDLIREALARAGGNQRRAAAALGLLPTTLHEKMTRLGIPTAKQGQHAPLPESVASAGPEQPGERWTS
jgi:DNA-binding NtrC family response regulator